MDLPEPINSPPRGSFFQRSPLIIPLTVFILIALGYAFWRQASGAADADSGPPAGIHWFNNFDAAAAQARQENKLMLVVFSASWCPACQVMHHEVWPDPAVVKAANTRFVCAYLDADQQANQQIMVKYGLDALPSILVFSPGGKALALTGPGDQREMLEFMGRDFSKAPSTATASIVQ